jgi:hypothetical protein
MKIEAYVNTHENKLRSRVNNAISRENFYGKLQTISQGKLCSQETTKSSFLHLIQVLNLLGKESINSSLRLMAVWFTTSRAASSSSEPLHL